MTATVYTTAAAMQTILAIKDLDYYDRCTLGDIPATDPTQKEGYYLKLGNELNLAALPDDAKTTARIVVVDAATYSAHVRIPTELRGCIFEKAPNLPPRYREIVGYWSGAPLNTNAGGAAYYQNPENTYTVDLSALEAAHEAGNYKGNVAGIDALLSEGIVIHVAGIGTLVSDASGDAFVEIEIPIDGAMVNLDNGDFLTTKKYDQGKAQRSERIFLRVSDIRNSPDPDNIFVDVLRYEEMDYGFYY
jgi:hypothetical protein